MKQILFILIILLANHLAAQEKVFLNENFTFCDQKDAIEYAIITKSDSGIQVEFHKLDGTLKGIGHYSKYGKNISKRVRDGVCIFKYANGQDSIVYHYADNKLDGEGKFYYPNGQLHVCASYKQNHFDGELKQFYPDGKTRRIETYEQDKCIKGTLWDEEGNELPFEPYFVLPEFPGGISSLYTVLSKYLIYPAKSFKNKEQGRVYVRFVIDEEGKMTNFKIADSQNMELEEPALKALKTIGSSYRWKPGTKDGKPIRVLHTLPVNFRLNN